MKHSIRANTYDNWYGYAGGKRIASFANDAFGSAEEHAQDWLRDREFEEKVKRFSVGRLVRVTDAARTDMVGRIVEAPRPGSVRVRVPGWQADGYHMDTVVSVHDVESATIVQLKQTVRKRGW